KGVHAGLQRGLVYVGNGRFQSDVSTQVFTLPEILAFAAPGSEETFTVVPSGTERRVGIDRDLDGAFDRDEIAACSDPANPQRLRGAFLDVSGGPIVSGETHAFRVSCAVPGRRVFLAYSFDGLGITMT